jgi:hypothetical protein
LTLTATTTWTWTTRVDGCREKRWSVPPRRLLEGVVAMLGQGDLVPRVNVANVQVHVVVAVNEDVYDNVNVNDHRLCGLGNRSIPLCAGTS